MKKIKIRAAALTLALVMGLTPLAQASQALGSEIQGSSVNLSVGTNLTKQIYWSDTYSDLRTERYFTYSPNASVTPVVAYGDKITKRATLTDMSKSLEQQGKRVVGGINGDLYVLATGTPLGLVVTQGVLRSSSAGHYGIGFREDGSAFIGSPDLSVTANFQGQTLAITGGINKIRTAEGGYVLLTEDFNATTQNTAPGVDVILTPVLEHVGQPVTVDLDISAQSQPTPTPPASPSVEPTPLAPASVEPAPPASPSVEPTPVASPSVEPTPLPTAPTEVKGTLVQSARPTIGGRVTYQVEQVLESAAGIPIPAGKAVLTINAKSTYTYLLDSLRALKPGDLVNVDITSPDPVWQQASYAMGGFKKLLTAGVVEQGLSAERTAYSAVGVKADGSAVFYTIDGKQPWYSVGATLTQVAMRLAELGCVEAVSLDGGGSTTAGATFPDGGAMSIINRPADGTPRANSVALFLATDLKPTGTLASYYVTPGDGLVLSGGTLPLTAVAVDTAYYQMPATQPVTWSMQTAGGTISPQGVFQAGSTPGVAVVTASGGAASGAAALTVVSTPDSVTLADEKTGAPVTALVLAPNQVCDLKAVSAYKHLPVTAQDTCYRWVLDPAAGTVDANGVLTAAAKSGSGSLSVSVGGTAITVPVTVAGHVTTLESFEDGMTAFAPTATVKLALEKSGDYVRYGKQSLRAEYDTSLTGSASVTTALNIAPGERYLNLWLYGNGSAASLTATVADAAGTASEVLLASLDTLGWKYLSVPLPAGAASLRSLNILYGGGDKVGAFRLDQLTTSNEPLEDKVPPVVSVSLGGTALTAVVTDLVDRKFTKKQMALTYDGKPLSFAFDEAKSSLSASLPAPDGKLHRVTVEASDASGNLGRGSANVEASPAAAPVFTDTAGHWSEPYALYLFDQKVTAGVPNDADATLRFQPDREISRGEFFLMLARWLGADVSAYRDTELPFADSAEIAPWALDGVKAMYAMGYLKGSMAGDGVLKANAAATISRAEAMTLLGRVQPGGHLSAELTFADAAEVPAWALPYVQTLVSQGVVGGFENKIMPTNPVRRGEVAKMLFTMR